MPHKEGFKKIIKENLPYSDTKIKGIEIGCFRGEFCCSLLVEFPELEMVTIDPRPKWKELLENQMDRLWILNVTSDIGAFLLRQQDTLFDFVFIDGDHSYEQCKKDIINYSPLVREGGIISGHNYHEASNSAHPGVHQAVKEVLGNNINLERDFIWWVKK